MSKTLKYQKNSMKKIYVGNLAWGTTNESLAAAFKPFGEVSSAVVMMDKMTGRSRGFGYRSFPWNV